MSTDSLSPTTARQRLTAQAAAHDAARILAVQLRQRAIDEFWCALRHALRAAWLRASRALRRAASQREASAPARLRAQARATPVPEQLALEQRVG